MSSNSAGGIVALALGHANLSVDDTIELIRNYANKAFIKHRGQNITGVKYVIEAHKHGRYRTPGVKECLKATFGEGRIFGECINPTNHVKVAVTLTTSSGYPCLVGTYNRVEPEMEGKSQLDLDLLLRFKLMEVLPNGIAAIVSLDTEPGTQPQYDFMRGANRESELRVWEPYVSLQSLFKHMEAQVLSRHSLGL